MSRGRGREPPLSCLGFEALCQITSRTTCESQYECPPPLNVIDTWAKGAIYVYTLKKKKNPMSDAKPVSTEVTTSPSQHFGDFYISWRSRVKDLKKRQWCVLNTHRKRLGKALSLPLMWKLQLNQKLRAAPLLSLLMERSYLLFWYVCLLWTDS